MDAATLEVTDGLKRIIARWNDLTAPAPPPTKPARYRVHRAALYQQPPSIPIKRGPASQLIADCRAAARRPMVAEGRRRSVRMMTKTAIEIFTILVNITERYGTCFPSIKYLMTRTDSSRRTVFRALRQLEDRGWIRRYPRRKPLRVGTSPEAQQDTNGYEVHHPQSALGPVLAAPQTRVPKWHG